MKSRSPRKRSSRHAQPQRAPALRQLSLPRPSIPPTKFLQAQRLRRLLRVSEPVALTLSGFVYGEPGHE